MTNRNITYLAETIKREIDRMCVTGRLSEVDTMALHAHENIRILQKLRYKQLVNDSQGFSQAEQTEPNSSEKPNNCEELNAYRKCVESRSFWDHKHCDGCYFDERCPFDEPKDEPQTDCSWK